MLTIVSMLYLLVALGIGLVASSVTKSQFVASQVALIATLLPALMLSGFLFDIRSMPIALQYITYVLPARYFVTLLQTIFLAGDIWSVILPNAAVLAAMAVLLIGGRARGDTQAARLRRAMQETLLRILALIRKELLAILKDPRSRVVLIAAADLPDADVRLRGDLRPEPRALCRARPGPQRRLVDAACRARRVAGLRARRQSSTAPPTSRS